jgi:hypothetical protein
MSGYQVQNPRFFVSLNPQHQVDAQIAFLQASFLRPQEYYYSTGNSGSTGLILSTANTSNTGAFIFNSYIAITGIITTVYLPSAAQIVKQALEYITAGNGNQVVNIPNNVAQGGNSAESAQRRAYNQIRNGFNYQFIIFNRTAGAITLSGGTDVIYDVGATIPTDDVGIFRVVVVESDLANNYASPLVRIVRLAN